GGTLPTRTPHWRRAPRSDACGTQPVVLRGDDAEGIAVLPLCPACPGPHDRLEGMPGCRRSQLRAAGDRTGCAPCRAPTRWTVRRKYGSQSWVNGRPSRLKLHDRMGVIRM